VNTTEKPLQLLYNRLDVLARGDRILFHRLKVEPVSLTVLSDLTWDGRRKRAVNIDPLIAWDLLRMLPLKDHPEPGNATIKDQPWWTVPLKRRGFRLSHTVAAPRKLKTWSYNELVSLAVLLAAREFTEHFDRGERVLLEVTSGTMQAAWEFGKKPPQEDESHQVYGAWIVRVSRDRISDQVARREWDGGFLPGVADRLQEIEHPLGTELSRFYRPGQQLEDLPRWLQLQLRYFFRPEVP
jgi:hypothetical protein